MRRVFAAVRVFSAVLLYGRVAAQVDEILKKRGLLPRTAAASGRAGISPC